MDTKSIKKKERRVLSIFAQSEQLFSKEGSLLDHWNKLKQLEAEQNDIDRVLRV
jgi:hypothetical protein